MFDGQVSHSIQTKRVIAVKINLDRCFSEQTWQKQIVIARVNQYDVYSCSISMSCHEKNEVVRN